MPVRAHEKKPRAQVTFFRQVILLMARSVLQGSTWSRRSKYFRTPPDQKFVCPIAMLIPGFATSTVRKVASWGMVLWSFAAKALEVR